MYIRFYRNPISAIILHIVLTNRPATSRAGSPAGGVRLFALLATLGLTQLRQEQGQNFWTFRRRCSVYAALIVAVGAYYHGVGGREETRDSAELRFIQGVAHRSDNERS